MPTEQAEKTKRAVADYMTKLNAWRVGDRPIRFGAIAKRHKIDRKTLYRALNRRHGA